MEKNGILDYIDSICGDIEALALDIWNHPEIADTEDYSTDMFRKKFEENGFRITNYDYDKHAFMAEYGSGAPVIAILGEYDALPGLSQKPACTTKEPVAEGTPGHACGHNLLGTASYGASLAIKKFLDESGKSGTVRFYGCPAEETLVGKVRMVKEGCFDGCDVAISWHPMNANAPLTEAYLANESIKFQFHGLSSHAAQSPEVGRSALDAVELMNVGANYLREHIIEKARMHYTITNAGGAPNIVPAEAESWYFVRAPHRSDVQEIVTRLKKVSEGAAMMTETTTESRVVAGCYEYLTNDVMFNLTHKNMTEIPLPEYTEEEQKFAQAIQESLDPATLEKERAKFISGEGTSDLAIHNAVLEPEECSKIVMAGSSDSGDVSWIMPMNVFITATWPLGVAAHTWQAAASSASSMGMKGMVYAAKVIAGMSYDMINDTSLVDTAKAEFAKRTEKQKYISPLA